eukprot:4333563-Amphidinium_carterae.2
MGLLASVKLRMASSLTAVRNFLQPRLSSTSPMLGQVELDYLGSLAAEQHASHRVIPLHKRIVCASQYCLG